MKQSSRIVCIIALFTLMLGCFAGIHAQPEAQDDTLSILIGNMELTDTHAANLSDSIKSVSFRTVSERNRAYKALWESKVTAAKAKVDYYAYAREVFDFENPANEYFYKLAWLSRQELNTALNKVYEYTPSETFQPSIRGQIDLKM